MTIVSEAPCKYSERTTDMSANIDPKLPGGFRDYLPADMIPRQKMLDTIRTVFERFGFLPLDTPGIEREEVLTGGDPNFKMQIFQARLRDGDDGLALRFDLTVPLARVVSLYPEDIEKPFKRYQAGKVWRGEKPQAGRFREFIQFDADIVGTTRPSADAEIVSLIYETLRALGFTRFIIRVNSRRILNGLPQFAGYNADINTDVLRIIDKLEKISWDGVSGELSDLSLEQPQLEKIKQFLDLQSYGSKDVLARLSELMGTSVEATEGVEELSKISASVKALGVPDEAWTIDLSVARGLGYYTGAVFETTLLDIPEIGSVFSGGRYDGLVSRFSAQNLPATGASIGVDRLFSAMEKLGIVKREQSIARVLVLNFDADSEEYCQRIVAMLRADNIPTEFYLGKEVTIKGQLGYAAKREFSVVIVAGGSEQSKSTAQVKDMLARTQKEFGLDSLLSAVKGVLAK